MIVITGAAGFIGSALAWSLNKSGREDLILVDEPADDKKTANLNHLKYSQYLEKKEFIDKVISLDKDLSGTEALLHMGACSSTTEKNWDFLKENNLEYTQELARWSMEHKVRFIYASSAATYGDGSQGYEDNEDGIDSLEPLNLYGKSKQLFDIWARENGLLKNIVGLKYFNVYGPNEYHKGDMRSMVLKGFEQVQETGKVKLFKSYKPEYKDGEQLRDFIYIKDAVNMTLHFLNRDIPGGIYNIGTGKSRSWLDMMNALFRSLEKEPDIEFIPMPEVLRDKYQYFTEANMNKFNSTGYNTPAHTLEEGIRDYTEYLTSGKKHLGE